MKNKLIGIIICTLLIATAIPVIGQVKNISIIRDDNEANPTNNGEKWIKTYGGPGMEYGKMVQLTNDGCYIVAGETCIEPANPPDYDGDWDYWLIKIDAIGCKIWDKTFSLYGYDECSAVKQTSDEGFILIGTSQRPVYPWDDTVWLIKTDKNGVKEWDKTYIEGSGASNGIQDVIQTSDGGYAIISLVRFHKINIARTDDAGNIIWDKEITGLCIENYGEHIKQTLDGGFVITGSAEGRAGILLVKLDSDGNVLWEKTFVKGTGYHGGYSVQPTNDGGFIICGYLYGYPGIGQYEGPWLIKTDSEGELIWDSKIGTSTIDYVCFSIQQTIDNGYIIAGRTDPIVSWDPILIKTDSEGQVEWRKTIDYLGSSMVNSVQQTTDGGYIAVGTVEYILNSDILLIKTDSEGNIGRNRVITNSFLIRLLEQFPLLQKMLCCIL